MSRRRVNTAEVVIRFRVPKGVSAAKFRQFIKGQMDLEIWPCWPWDEIMGGSKMVGRVAPGGRIIPGKSKG